MKKRILTIFTAICCLFTCAGLFSSCGDENDDGKIKIVTTIFPEYDWVMNIVGKDNENVDVTLLLDKGADLHSYQPTAKDMITLTTCDLFIYVGGESDSWVSDALKQSKNKDMLTINLLEELGDRAKEEEIVEGMEGEHEEENADSEEEAEYDEHVWLSIKNACIFVDKIAEKLSAIDEANRSAYLNNASEYKEKLDALDKEYAEAVKAATCDTLLFGDRFPFRYMTEDYGIKYYAAFVGCSAETEASFETVKFLAEKTDELGLKVIFKLESSDGKIAQTIKNSTKNKDQTIETLDSLQSSSLEEYRKGRTYLAVMASNLEVLKKALI